MHGFPVNWMEARGSALTPMLFLQTLLGLFYLFLAISALVTALTTGSNIESSWQYGLSFVLTVIAGTAWLVVGSMGLAATTNLKAIVELSYDRAVKPAMRYYAANTYGFFIMSAVLFLGAVLYTMGILLDTYANDDGDPLLKETWQVVLSLVTIWLLALLGIGLQFYFLYIVWSYKAKLEAAYYGRPYRGSFVVDGEGPRPSISKYLIPSGAVLPAGHEHRWRLRNALVMDVSA